MPVKLRAKDGGKFRGFMVMAARTTGDLELRIGNFLSASAEAQLLQWYTNDPDIVRLDFFLLWFTDPAYTRTGKSGGK